MGSRVSLTVALWSPTGLMGTSTVEQLLENVCLLLASRTRDVVKSALGFIKVVGVVMDVAHLAKHVPLVVSAPFPLSGRQPGLWPAGMDPVSARPASPKHVFSCALSHGTGHAGALERTSRVTRTRWE